MDPAAEATFEASFSDSSPIKQTRGTTLCGYPIASDRSSEERLADVTTHIEKLIKDESCKREMAITDLSSKILEANLCCEDNLANVVSKVEEAVAEFAAHRDASAELREEKKDSAGIAQMREMLDAFARAQEATARGTQASLPDGPAKVREAQTSYEQRLDQVEAALRKVATKVNAADLRLGDAFLDSASTASNLESPGGAQTTETTGVSDSLDEDSHLEEKLGGEGTAPYEMLSGGTPETDRSFDEAGLRCDEAKVFIDAETHERLERRVLVMERRFENRGGVAHRHFVAEPCPAVPAPRDQSLPAYCWESL